MIDDDCLAFKHDEFERVLIFDRKPTTDDGYGVQKNLNKEAFLRLFHLLMTLLVHADENAQGYFGIVKPARRPEPIKFTKPTAEHSRALVAQTTFSARNAIVAVEDQRVKRVNTIADEFFE